MTHRLAAWLHAWLLTSVAVVSTRLRVAPQRGQGTVEYVALILLVAGVFAAAVTVASSKQFNLGTVVADQLKKAISTVSK